MEFQYLQAFLLLAYEAPPLSLTKIPNEYCGDHDNPKGVNCEICQRRPWWLIETNVGKIKVGWRKRVIVLDWRATGFALGENDVTTANVTKDEYSVHCYGYADLLQKWEAMLHRLRCLRRDQLRAAEELEA